MPITLVIADDHPLILDAMENLFRLEKDLKVVARCLEGDAALKAVRRHQPDILVLDIQMPAKDGLAVLRDMRKETLPTRVVILTATLDEEGLTEAVRLGVRGLVLKHGARLALAGSTLGLLGAALLVRLLQASLFGISRFDPPTYAMGTLLVLAAALLACIVPAVQAVRNNPANVLRSA